MILDTDQDLTTRLYKSFEFKHCIDSQIRQQIWKFSGNTSKIASVEIYYTVLVDVYYSSLQRTIQIPKIYYIVTQISPDAIERYNIDSPYFRSRSKYIGMRYEDKTYNDQKPIKFGKDVIEEIIDESYERFQQATNNIDPDRLFMFDSLPEKAM